MIHPDAIASEITAELLNLAAWPAELSDERIEEICNHLAGAIRTLGKDPAASLLTAYRGIVLTEIDRRTR